MSRSTANERLGVVAIALAAICLRLVRLGALSFAGDEETTTLAALALLDGWPPELPGGLVYLRALPFTALESVAIALGGTSEWTLRLIPVLASGPRVAATWWLARPFLGPGGALAAAGVLAVMPLDLELSRNARMYSLFAMLDVVFVAASVQLVWNGRHALLAGASGALASILHGLGVIHAPLPVLAAIARGVTPRRIIALGAVAFVALAAFAAESRLSNIAYGDVGVPTDAAESAGPAAEHAARLAACAGGGLAAVCAGLGVLVALGGAAHALRRLRQPGARLVAAAAGLAFAGASPVLGGVALLLAPPLEGVPLRTLAGRAAGLAVAAAAATAGWALAALGTPLPDEGALERAARLLLGFPAPNWLEFALAAPAFSGLALLGALVAAARGARTPQPGAWVLLLGAAFSPALVGGMVLRNPELRFHVQAVAPLAVLALLAGYEGARRLTSRGALAWGAAFLLVVLSVRPDQSLHAVLRGHGPVAEPFAFQDVAPDHRGAARFVAARLAPGEGIAAEDSLQQRLYLGRTDFWLRRIEDAADFVRRDPQSGALREVYTGARHVHDLEALREIAAQQGYRDVWLITSGEVEMAPAWYRTERTDETLRRWRPLAWFVADDGLTRVYRLRDGRPEPPPP